MIRLALILGLLWAVAGLPEAVHAQGCGQNNPNCIVPTAPPGTSNNQAASTEFAASAARGAGIDPKSYGAKCDGVTDDSTPVHLASAAAQTAKVPLRFSGVCFITSGIGFTDASMMIAGSGWNTGLLVGVTGPALRFVTAQPIVVRDMRIQYTPAFAKMGVAIEINAPNGQENFGTEISNVWIDKAQTGIQVIRGSRYSFHDNLISAGVNGFDLNNINLTDSGDGAVYNNIVQGMDNASVLWQGGGATRIYGNKLLGGVYGVQIDFVAAASTVSPQATANSIEGMSGACLKATRQGATGTLVSMLFQDNECAAALGVWIPVDAAGPWIEGLTYTGGYFQGGANSAALTINSVDIVAIGPLVINATQTPVYPYIIGATATNVSVGQIQCNSNCIAGANSGPSTTFALTVSGEQTCTLTVTFGGTTATLDGQFCSYVVLGTRVYVNFYVAISNKNGGTGELDFANLPIAASSNNANLGSIGAMQVAANGIGLPQFMSISVNPGTSTAKPFYQAATARGNLDHTSFGACAPGSECVLLGGFSYIR